jgi:drug/metabolite transporter (DMT)-like permease
VISVVLALLTSASNATASVLQRRAASQARTSRPLGLSLIADLVRRRIWLAGIAMVVVASVLQAGALATGPIALVQPIFIVELPLTLLLSSYVWHRRLALRTWGAVALVTVSLGTGLAAVEPSGGTDHAPAHLWILALIATGCFETVLILSALRVSGEPRAALLGLAAACGYALTAALLKEAVSALGQGAAAFFGTWQLYGVAIAGVGSLFLLQNALQAGTLVASQPMLTVGDALISITFGVLLFGEQLRLGWFLIPEIVALVLIVVGYIEIARSPVATAHDEPVPPALPVAVGAAAARQAGRDPGDRPAVGGVRRHRAEGGGQLAGPGGRGVPEPPAGGPSGGDQADAAGGAAVLPGPGDHRHLDTTRRLALGAGGAITGQAADPSGRRDR